MHFIEPSFFEIQYVLTFWRRSILTLAFIELDLQKVHFNPILTYNSEVWRAYKKSYLQFRKSYLEVSNKAINVACRTELGRFPLLIAINQRIMITPHIFNKQRSS